MWTRRFSETLEKQLPEQNNYWNREQAYMADLAPEVKCTQNRPNRNVSNPFGSKRSRFVASHVVVQSQPGPDTALDRAVPCPLYWGRTGPVLVGSLIPLSRPGTPGPSAQGRGAGTGLRLRDEGQDKGKVGRGRGVDLQKRKVDSTIITVVSACFWRLYQQTSDQNQPHLSIVHASTDMKGESS